MLGRQSITAPVVILLLGCGADPADSPGPEVAVHGRYVLLASSPAGNPVAFARVIIDADQPCPTITGEATLPMSPRDNPHGFSVKVCEAVVPFDKQLEVPIGDATFSLPVAKPDPVRILAMGDTGCQANDCQSGEAAEPFRSLASSATAGDWDVILHMGNYNFRGTPSKDSVTGERIYDAGDGTAPGENCLQAADSGFVSQNAPGSGPRDHWGNWRDEFFAPAGELLWSAPWIFARGNRELCSRAGPGWFYFLDPSSNLREGGGKQLSCPAPDAGRKPIDNVVLLGPYRVALGTLNLVVLDSANACDAFATPPMKDFTNAYTRQFARLRELAPNGRISWLMTHRPVWGVQQYEQHKSTACTEANRYGC
ncbi:MAG: hypothetical protein GY953_06340, partial [bacterium]|nr:hypothetical protein [bacterium]